MKEFLRASLLGALALLALAARAAEHDHAAAPTAAVRAQAAVAWSEGTVKKLDKAGGRITLAHGPLLNLDMGAMTMTFRVKQKKWLDKLKDGDKLRFVADSVDGELTVTRIEGFK